MIKAIAVFSVLILLCLAPLTADIAPTQFIGSGIVPQTNTVIRMEKADVEILWGTPSSLLATFTMVNPSSESQTLEIGFPITREFPFGIYKPGMQPEPLSMAFDGIDGAVVAPPVQREDDGNQVWYRCLHTFHPGRTVITVKTILRASVTHIPFHESLFYCIETGGRWAGTIGEETVTIRFPHPIEENQITRAAPGDFKIEGDSVRWHLVDIDPKGKEFDINLTYFRPDAMRALADIRRDLARDPSSSSLTIKLARNLFIFGPAKSNSGFLPQSLSREEHASISSKITDPHRQRAFARFYRQTDAGAYQAMYNESREDYGTVINILADAGYRDAESKSIYILEAQSLIEDLLKREPHNAEAWNVYLANFWRFSYAAVGRWFGSHRFNKAQIQAIQTAAQNCPDDECIQDWLKLSKTDGVRIDPLQDKIKKAGYYHVDLPIPRNVAD